jgi:hypothetical protein
MMRNDEPVTQKFLISCLLICFLRQKREKGVRKRDALQKTRKKDSFFIVSSEESSKQFAQLLVFSQLQMSFFLEGLYSSLVFLPLF